jgi:predicted metalloprotease with PDZ domain
MSRNIKYSKAAFNDTLPFTKLSSETLGEYQDQYGNVYLKGALIGFCLDVTLRDLSDGKYGTQDLMSDLSKLYGRNKAFKEDDLFDEIAKLTYPQLRDFFKNYVEGSMPLPYESYFEKIGVDYYDSLIEREISFGGVTLGYNQKTNRIKVRDIDNLNEFGKEIAYEKDDELVSINGVEITGTNFNKIMPEIKSKIKPGDVVTIELSRSNSKGKEKIIKKSAPALETEKVKRNVLQIMENPSERQLEIRKAWGNI